MAQIRAFRALRYDTGKAGEIESLVCPPYDVISEAEREALLSKSPYNMVRLELPRGDDPYAQAGALLMEWRESGVLKTDMDEGIYIYEEEFSEKVTHGEKKALRGLICRVRLEDFSAGVVLPHEETLSKAKEDRFRLMEATGCNFSQIYSLYQDPQHTTRKRLDALASTCPPRYDFSDGLVTHRLWVVNDPVAIEALRKDFADRKLYIADGHHRYETALRYREHHPEADHVMMMLVNMEDPGLVVFPTHRLLSELSGFDAAALPERCGEFFAAARHSSREETETALADFYQAGQHAFGYFDGAQWYTLLLKDAAVMDGVLPERSEAYRRLDVSILHSLILERLLGIDRENMAAQKNLSYTRSAEEAEQSVQSGKSQCCFLLNPTRVAEIGAVATAGEKMPQKSTYFYPKLITGLVLNPLTEQTEA